MFTAGENLALKGEGCATTQSLPPQPKKGPVVGYGATVDDPRL